MSHHVLTINTEGVFLRVSRGFIVCQEKNNSDKKIPISDVKTVIISTPQVSFSNQCISRMLENNIVILHCAENYQPIGWTVGLEKVVRREAFFNQIQATGEFSDKLWNQIAFCKIHNQLDLLDDLGFELNIQLSNNADIEEARVARYYWERYFGTISRVLNRERKNASKFENKALNYGYAVIKTLIYRAILIHGLLPALGIKHKSRFHAHPLVYDLIEPFRAFVDLLLAHYIIQNKKQIDNLIATELIDEDEVIFADWIKFFMSGLVEYKLKDNNLNYKILDFVDMFVLSIMKAYENLDSNSLRLPILKTYSKS
jgi:CRISP-associated protein Cas1